MLSRVQACPEVPPPEDPSVDPPEFPSIVYGVEGSDPETTSFFVNHLSLNVANLTESIDFYSSVFGLRMFITFRLSPHISIAYMAHNQGGKNGTGYQSVEELVRDKNNLSGLVELINLDVPGNELPASTVTPTTFGHIGMIVPDMEAMQARLDRLGVTSLKRYLEDTPADGPIAKATYLGSPELLALLDEGEFEAVVPIFNSQNRNLIFVADPDGNLIEIQPQSGAALGG